MSTDKDHIRLDSALDEFCRITGAQMNGMQYERQLEVALDITLEALGQRNNEVIGMRIFCVIAIIAAVWGWAV